jgi:phosphatidylserine/phosphatidylglycerophosphate/cardiolipin synthase-like enzyme
MIKYLLLAFFIFNSLFANGISISEARRKPVGTIVSITGTVLNGSEFGLQRFIDDGTDAICIYSPQLAAVNKGDVITVQGSIEDYHSLIEVINLTQLTVNSSGVTLPEKPVLFPYQLKESYESRLVETRNVYIPGAAGFFTANTGYIITDGRSTSELYIKTGTSLVGQPVPTDVFNVSGICFQYDDTYEILPRSVADIITPTIYINSNPEISNITSAGFQINWETNISGTSFLNYGLTNALELGTLAGINSATPSINITGTLPSEIYYFQAMSISGTDTALSPVMMGITSSAVPGNVSVYFNRSINASVASPSGNIAHYTPNAFDDTIASIINSAQQTIDISIYSFTSSGTTNIISAINNAYAAGKQVRVIYDGNYTLAGIQLLNSNIPKLASPLSDFYYSICHNKVVIVDAAIPSAAKLITGSTNFSNGQLYDDANHLVVIRDQSMAKVYTLEFEEQWGSNSAFPNPLNSRFGYYKKDNTPHQVFVGNTLIESYFSPSDNINRKISDNINSADASLYFSLLLFTKTDFAADIVQRITSGVTCSGILHDTSGTSAINVFNSIYNQVGPLIQIYTPQLGNEILHHKYMIVDQNTTLDPLVLTGSHNWSYTAETKNDENTIVIHDALIANQFYQEFYKRMQDNGIILQTVDLKDNTGITLYPVPANKDLNILLNSKQGTFRIINAEGMAVASLKLIKGNNPFSVNDLANGLYILIAEDGTISGKFIIQH